MIIAVLAGDCYKSSASATLLLTSTRSHEVLPGQLPRHAGIADDFLSCDKNVADSKHGSLIRTAANIAVMTRCVHVSLCPDTNAAYAEQN